MFLKSLSMKGFKSFADATRLDLEPGITVVVGPNGSGKSNVVDAIGWVLGAQAPSIVRSKAMDDVIFAGTSQRPALGRAEVALTIDNSAGLLPIEFTEVTISRTLFRSGDSEYAINNVPCRLLDIQDLLSDSGVGRQQHVIVSQGQIDAVLNAKAEDRRAIIAEAAGILKYRKRKERSERRLLATEGNLNRLQDLVREVRRQLRPLEKQADAARRHAGVVAELTALRLYIAGRQIDELRTRLETAVTAKTELTREAEDLKGRLAHLDAEVTRAEAELSARGADDVGDDLVRFESLRERARGLAAVLKERARGIERERLSFTDQGVIFSLEADAATLRRELTDVAAEVDRLTPELSSLAEATSALEADRTAFDLRADDTDTDSDGRAAEARGELVARRGGIERDTSELNRLESRLAELAATAERLDADAEHRRLELERIVEAERPLIDALEEAEHARSRVEHDLGRAEDALRRADAERHRWSARADALELALEDARSRSGADHLTAVDGVLGPLFDAIEVDDGWLPAVEAAVGEALGTVVVADVAAARRAIVALREGEHSGAVLPVALNRPPADAPSVGEAVRGHVRARRPEVEAVLDALVGAAVAVEGDWTVAADAAEAHPAAVIVTRTGDRFSPTGWRVGRQQGGATKAALDDARDRAETATIEHAAAVEALDSARRALTDAQGTEADVAREIDEHDGRRTTALEGLTRVDADRRDGATEKDALTAHRDEVAARLDREQARVTELESGLAELEDDEDAAKAAGRELRLLRGAIEERAADLSARRTDLEVRQASLRERQRVAEQRLGEIEPRLAKDAHEREHAESRRSEIDARATAVERLTTEVEARSAEIDQVLDGLRERRRQQSEAVRGVAARLDGLRRERGEAERTLAEVRERSQREEVREAEVAVRLETAVETLRVELDCEPDRAVATDCPDLPEGNTATGRARELERDLRLMGPINPLALEEFEQLQERHGFLQGQLEDVQESRRELRKVIKAVDDEIRDVFTAAYADVAANFESLFATLFPGGTGRLSLTDPDNLLDTGLEIEARPSGKNVRKLSLLSGGERSLTALAFLFAVFRSRPSPFYVMDEVEAALDDVNLHRFLDLLAEFRLEAQLIVVSHQKRTMEAGDVLYGVTMQPGGSSKVISERVTESELVN
ncbi:MAG: chromosome segregation protein SMC [Acidimicrobiales bacterium]